MNISLITAFIVSNKFVHVGPSFSLKSRQSLISLLISSLTQRSLYRKLISFHEIVGFLLLLLKSSFTSGCSDKIKGFI